jgi:hypothetical protein
MNYENKYYEFTDNNLNPRILYDIFTILFGVRKIGLIHLPIGKYNFIQKQLIDFNLFEVAIRYLIISEDEGSRENLLRDTDNNDNATHIELWFSREESIEVNPFKNPGKTLSYPDCCVKSYESNLGLSNFYNKYLFSNEPRYYTLNRLVVLFNEDLLMPDYFPCSLSCQASRLFIENANSIVLDKFPKEIISKVVKIMKVPLLLWGDDLIYVPDWEVKSNNLYLQINNNIKSQKIKNIFKLHENNTKLLNTDEPKLLKFNHLLGLQNLYLNFTDESQKIYKLKYI